MSGKNWSIANTILGIVGGICGLATIITEIKASNYEQEQQYKELEDRYGLVPKRDEEAE